MEQAIAYEIERQTDVLNGGENPIQETRGWDVTKQKSFSQRTKETAEDYRYFPDPDIPPLQFTKEQVEGWRKELPKLKEGVIKEQKEKYGVNPNYSDKIIVNHNSATIISNASPYVKKQGIEPNDLVKDIVNKNIYFGLDSTPESLSSAYQQLHQTDDIDTDVLTKTIAEVLAVNPDAVAKYKAGKTQVVGFLLGQVAQKLQQKLDMKQVRSELLKALEN